MSATIEAIEFEVIYEPEHYNRNCGCTIPAAWVALVYVNDEPLPKWPCGDTREEAVANVKREWPTAKQV